MAEIIVLTGQHTYVFRADDPTACLNAMAQESSKPGHALSWFDVAVAAHQLGVTETQKEDGAK